MSGNRKPVAHSVALWVLCGLVVSMLLAAWGYFSVLARLRRDVVQAKAPKSASSMQERQPSLFGMISGIQGRRLKVESKQGYTEILFDEDTAISSGAGKALSDSQLSVGAVITATGKDLGGGRMGAAAIVVLDDSAQP